MLGKNSWIIGIFFLVIIGLVAILFSRNTTPSSLPGNSADVYVFDFDEFEHKKGIDEAVVTLVEFSDFQCPACRVYSGAINEIVTMFPDDVRIVYKHFPLRTIHPNAYSAAEASVSASMQGFFWEMHDMLFEKQTEWSRSNNSKDLFVGYANEIGLDTEKFLIDMNSEAVKNKVNSDLALANKLKLNSTPTIYMNGKLLKNPSSLEEFVSLIQSEIESLTDSTVEDEQN